MPKVKHPERQIVRARSRLAQLRVAAGLEQAELARLAELTPEYYHRVEHGRSVPTVIVAIRLAKILGVTIEGLDWRRK